LRSSEVEKPPLPGERDFGVVLYKNRGNELKDSLKTKEDAWLQGAKRTQNETNFGRQMRELKPNSQVARLRGKKPLTWLATLATLSPRKRVRTRFCGGTKRECL
jgi:hypothetical protein